jgi:hypothetical protein
MVAAAAPAQADPQLFIGLQEAGVNGGAITTNTPYKRAISEIRLP